MTSGSVVPPRPYDPADPKPTTFPQVLRDEIDRVAELAREARGWHQGLRQTVDWAGIFGRGDPQCDVQPGNPAGAGGKRAAAQV